MRITIKTIWKVISNYKTITISLLKTNQLIILSQFRVRMLTNLRIVSAINNKTYSWKNHLKDSDKVANQEIKAPQ